MIDLCASGAYKNGATCDGSTTTDLQTCSACGNGGAAAYTCASGAFQSGTSCDGTSTSDTQTCTTCGNGGSEYTCASGFRKTGQQCTGEDLTDVQTCVECQYGASSNYCKVAGCTSYTCNPKSLVADGTTCDGAGYNDTQTCKNKWYEGHCQDGRFWFERNGGDGYCEDCLHYLAGKKSGATDWTCKRGYHKKGTACDGTGKKIRCTRCVLVVWSFHVCGQLTFLSTC